MGKEIVSKATRDPRKTKPRHIIIKMAKIKDKDKVLKEAREREKRSHTDENPSGYHQTSQQKIYRPERSGMMYLMQ